MLTTATGEAPSNRAGGAGGRRNVWNKAEHGRYDATKITKIMAVCKVVIKMLKAVVLHVRIRSSILQCYLV